MTSTKSYENSQHAKLFADFQDQLVATVLNNGFSNQTPKNMILNLNQLMDVLKDWLSKEQHKTEKDTLEVNDYIEPLSDCIYEVTHRMNKDPKITREPLTNFTSEYAVLSQNPHNQEKNEHKYIEMIYQTRLITEQGQKLFTGIEKTVLAKTIEVVNFINES